MTKTLVAIAAVAGFVAYCFQRGSAQRALATRNDLTRWEGEGGNVPQVSTPSPAPVPPSSFPGGSEARH